MQKIVKFNVNGQDSIDEQIQSYLDSNSGETIVSLTALHNEGDEIVVVVLDDGQ